MKAVGVSLRNSKVHRRTSENPATPSADTRSATASDERTTMKAVGLKQGLQRKSSTPAPSTSTQSAGDPFKGMMPVLDELLANSPANNVQNVVQQQRQLRKLLNCLEDWDNINDETLLKLINQIKDKDLETLDEKLNPLIQQILNGNWPNRSIRVVKAMEEFLSEVLVAKSSFAGLAIHSLTLKFNPLCHGHGANFTFQQPDETSLAEEKIFRIAHRNLQKVFEAFPMKKESGVKTMSSQYPYMTKPPHVHYCYVKNLLQMIDYIPECEISILHLIIHKLTRIDVNIPKEDFEASLIAYTENSFDVKNETGGQQTFNAMDMEIEGLECPFTENPLVQTVDLCLNLVLDHLSSKTFGRGPGEEEGDGEAKQLAFFNCLLTIFETEILPTFGVCDVQYLFFYLINLRPKFSTIMLDFLWKKVITMNTTTIIRIQATAYISGILARSTVISIKTVKRWLTKLADWANEYVDNKVAKCHWSSVNIASHGIFYGVCQAIFYVFAFRNKELIGNRKCVPFTRTLNLGRLVTSELNPLKVCSDDVAENFVAAAHQHQVSYCRTVLERNQTVTIPLVSRDSMRNVMDDSNAFTVTQLESFFPFDPCLLRRSKVWIDPIYRIYEPYFEELKIEKTESESESSSSRSNNLREENEDSIEMELSSSYTEKSSVRSMHFYCNGATPFKCKQDLKEELDEFIDL